MKDLVSIIRFLITEAIIKVRDFISDVKYEFKSRKG
jgi:hypothetical protein